LILKELSISNFKGFHGTHILSFREGANVVVGGPGSGKTSLCDAVAFALFGGDRGTDELYGLVNRMRVEEADTKCLWAGCKVGALFMDEAGEHMVDRDFTQLDEGEVKETVLYSSRLPRFDRSLFREAVRVGELPLAPDPEGSTEVIAKHLLGLAERNVADGIGFMILDDVLSHLPPSSVGNLLSGLLGHGLDQVILLTDKPPQRLGARLQQLGKTIETVTFKVEGFPFEPKHLRRELEHIVWNSYVAKGDVFVRDVYGHVYTVAAVEVAPDGAMYLAEVSTLTMVG